MQQRPPPRPLTADGILSCSSGDGSQLCAVFVRNALTRWRLLLVVENAELVVSELVTNAVCATGITDTPLSYPELANVSVLTVRLSVLEPYLRLSRSGTVHPSCLGGS